MWWDDDATNEFLDVSNMDELLSNFENLFNSYEELASVYVLSKLYAKLYDAELLDSSWDSRKIQLLQEQDFNLVYQSIEIPDVLFQTKNSMDSYMKYYQEARATSSFFHFLSRENSTSNGGINSIKSLCVNKIYCK